MSQYPDEIGAWWTEFPGSDRATRITLSPPSVSALAPAQDGVRGAVSKRALKHRLVVPPGKRERARREATASWRRHTIAAIREPSLKSGVITLGSGFGGTGKTDVAVTLAAIYAAARPADRVILADSNDDMPHGYIRLGGVPVEALPPHQRTLSIRGFYQACTEGSIKVYADLRDAVAWLQGVAVIRGDTADECVGVDFGEHEYQAVLEFLQCMSNIVINDGGTGLFAKLQVGTLLHGDKYVFVTEASQLGFWSIGQVFGRYRNYEGERERPLSEQEKKHLNVLMDEATIVVDKFIESDPEQARWNARICESFEGTRVSVVATPWDQALANRGTLDLGAVAGATLDAKLAMAEVVLRGVDRANRRRLGLPGGETQDTGNGQGGPAEPPRWFSQPEPPAAVGESREPTDGAEPERQAEGWPPLGPQWPGSDRHARPAGRRGMPGASSGQGPVVLPDRPGAPNAQLGVTVIVPAHNEEDGIRDTLDALARQTVSPERVIVVDDCSQDSTGHVAREYGVDVLRPPRNLGSKARAQNYALPYCVTDLVLPVDADTILAPDYVERIKRPFDDPLVVIAAGNVQTRFTRTVTERGRSIEYLYGFHFYRPIQNKAGAPIVCSGCCSAFRRDVLVGSGGFPERTIVEDFDWTATQQIAGNKAIYVAGAEAWAADPETPRYLRKQMNRWMSGFFQNMRLHFWRAWRHKPMLALWYTLAIAEILMLPLWWAGPFLWVFIWHDPFIRTLEWWLALQVVLNLPVLMYAALRRRVNPLRVLINFPFVYFNGAINSFYAWKGMIVELILVPLGVTRGLTVYEKGRL
jgi:N-acetylglucosaminyltransferase